MTETSGRLFLRAVKKYFTALAAAIFRHLKQLPYIVLYPFMAIINLLYSIISYFYHWLDDRFQDVVMNQKRLTRLTRGAVQAALTGHSNILAGVWAIRLTRLFTLMLQVISLLTTYAGFTFFLKHINPAAPVLLALVIQGTFYYLINSRSGNKREGAGKRAFLLILVLLISITTSFVGLSNTVRNPVEDMAVIYDSYVAQHNDVVDAQIAALQTFDAEQIQQTLYVCEELRNGVENVVNNISLPVAVAGEATTNNIGVNPDGRQVNIPGTFTSYDPQVQQKRADLQTLINQIRDIGDKLPDLSALVAEDIFAAYAAETPTKDQQDLLIQFENGLAAYQGYENLLYEHDTETGYKTLYPQKRIDPNVFSRELLNNYEMRKDTLKSARLIPYRDFKFTNSGTTDTIITPTPVTGLINHITQAFSDLEKLFVSPELSNSETIRVALNAEMTDKYALLDVAGRSQLRSAYEAARLPSSQLYPFFYLTRVADPNWGSSLLAVVIAATVDMLSLILSFTLVKRRHSILYAKNHQENVRNREEILEDCYTYLCMRELTDQPKTAPKRLSAADIQTKVSRIIEQTMWSFLQNVKVCCVADSLDSLGYIPSSVVEDFNWKQYDLFQTFRLIHLLRPITKNEFVKLLINDFPAVALTTLVVNQAATSENDNPKTSLPQKYIDTIPDELLYLVDNRLLMWHNENFAELLQNSLLSDDLFADSATDGENAAPAVKPKQSPPGQVSDGAAEEAKAADSDDSKEAVLSHK